MQRELDIHLYGLLEDPRAGVRDHELFALRQEIAALKRQAAGRHSQPPAPEAGLWAWFDYKHSQHPTLSLKKIAQLTRYSYGYVRKQHARYQRAQSGHK